MKELNQKISQTKIYLRLNFSGSMNYNQQYDNLDLKAKKLLLPPETQAPHLLGAFLASSSQYESLSSLLSMQCM
jgi:hypothetical protein